MHKMPSKDALSEFVGDPGRNQASPGFIHHRAVSNFIRQTGIARGTVNTPVAEEVVAGAQLQVRAPAVVRVIATQTAASGLFARYAIIVFVLVFAVPLHTNTRSHGQATVGVTIQPGHIPDDAVAVIQGIASQGGTQVTVPGKVSIRQTS